MTVSVDAIDADGVRQTRNKAMVISVGNGNMLGNIYLYQQHLRPQQNFLSHPLGIFNLI